MCPGQKKSDLEAASRKINFTYGHALWQGLFVKERIEPGIVACFEGVEAVSHPDDRNPLPVAGVHETVDPVDSRGQPGELRSMPYYSFHFRSELFVRLSICYVIDVTNISCKLTFSIFERTSYVKNPPIFSVMAELHAAINKVIGGKKTFSSA